MSRVLLLCPEPLGRGQPAGVGIRFLEFARALRDDGQEITLLSLDAGGPAWCAPAPLTPESIAGAARRSDVAIVQGHAANDLIAHGGTIPTVIDLYDPFIVENFTYHESRGDEVFVHDHATLMRSAARGDLFLCASEAQRLFYLGVLLATGRLNPRVYAADSQLDSLIAIVPFGVPPLRPARRSSAPHNVIFGGIYDWYDPRLAIDAVATARSSIPDLTLTFTHHPNAEMTPQGEATAAKTYVDSRGYGQFVRFEPWIPYEQRASYYDQFGAALLTFPRSLETDLAMRTRIFDYLWAGIPVITSSAPGTDEIIRAGAGKVIDSSRAADFAAAVVELLTDADAHAAAVAGARAWASGHQWEKLLQPLLRFCRAPKPDPFKNHYTFTSGALSAPPRPLVRRILRRLGGAL